ncbi:MAG: hypothetical protein WBH85_03755 [Thermoanaerobaculia bacterium]
MGDEGENLPTASLRWRRLRRRAVDREAVVAPGKEMFQEQADPLEPAEADEGAAVLAA